MLAGLIMLVILGTSVWVYADARQLGVETGSSGMLFEGGPVAWALGCLLVWIVVFPMYLAARPRFVRQHRNQA